MSAPGDGYEVVVLGGGPAGCAAATLLARRSHRVALVCPSAPPAAALAQSVPPSARKLLAETGLLDAVEAAGFVANGGNTVWWAGAEARSESFAEGARGWHTDRARLEAVLVAAAEAVGVRVYRGATARAVTESDAGWTVRCDGIGEAPELHAQWVIDATGRHGLLARPDREPDRGTTTLAVVARWRKPGGWDEAGGHTLIESYEDGWAWSVPTDADTRCVTAMIDQRHADLDGVDLDTLLGSELAKAARLQASLSGATQVDPAWACPASLYSSRRYGRRGVLLAGDAGSFIDPLSSYGVKKALSSGWLAGITAHTALVDPSMTDVAVGFFDERERNVYREYRRASAVFFREAATVYRHPFWSTRAEAAEAAGRANDPDRPPRPGSDAAGEEAATGGRHGDGGAQPSNDDPDRVGPRDVPEDEVRAAFEAIRERERLAAGIAADVRVVRRPAIEGYRLVLADHMATDAYPEGLRFVRGVEIGTLCRVAPEHAEVPDGWTAYNAVAPPVTLPDYLTALSTAFAAGLLEHRDG